MWGKNEGACVPRWRGETRRGRLRAEGRRLLRGNRGRSAEGAATIEQVRHRAMGSAGEGRSGRHLLASKALAWAERPPLWGSDDVSAMRNYRYRHRDSPYVARRSGERTARAGRPTAANFPERGGADGLCARCGRPCKGQRRHKRARVGFFIHIHPRLRRAGHRRGGKADRSVQRPVILVRCVGHGSGARGVGAVGLHVRGGARSTGRAGQRGGMRRGVKPHCTVWAMIRAGA